MFKDMIEIEKKFGALKLGHDEEFIKKMKPQKITSPHWAFISQFLQYNKKQMDQFKQKVDESVAAAGNLDQIEKGKNLHKFIQNKRSQLNKLSESELNSE